MTQSKRTEAARLMAQMDIEMQNYVIDILRHLKFAQDALRKDKPTYNRAAELDTVETDGNGGV